jgi:hypothetical protein
LVEECEIALNVVAVGGNASLMTIERVTGSLPTT